MRNEGVNPSASYDPNNQLKALLSSFFEIFPSCSCIIICQHQVIDKVKIMDNCRYWSNTAASVIASEIHKGQSNLPPKHHSVYQWPEGLFKPDAVIFLHKKSGLRTDKQKL